MTAKTADVGIVEEKLVYGYGALATSALIYRGTMVAYNSSGLVVPVTATTGLNIQGLSEQQVSEDDGDTHVKWRYGVFWVDNSATNPVAAGHLGETVYGENNYTVGSLPTGMSPAGRAVKLNDDASQVLVEFTPTFVSGLAAANNLSDVGSAATAFDNLIGAAAGQVDPVHLSSGYREIAEDGALTLAATDRHIRLLSSATGTKTATMTATHAGHVVYVELFARSGGQYDLAAGGLTVTLDAAAEYVTLLYTGSAWIFLRPLGGTAA